MRTSPDTTTVELLPYTSKDPVGHRSEDRNARSSSFSIKHACTTLSHNAWLIVLLVTAVVPITLLLVYSSRLSQLLGKNGCMPDGTFVLPSTNTKGVWDNSLFFAITVGFTGPETRDCSSSEDFLGEIKSEDEACTGYSFASVKSIDVVFDLLVGRGGQLLLTLLAYHLFGKVLSNLMQRGEVAYDMYSAIALEQTSLTSIQTLFKHAIGATPVPHTKGARRLYLLMGIATLYIVAFPSLVSAMSGYTSYQVPYVSNTTYILADGQETLGNYSQTVTHCDGGLYPVWGMFLNTPESDPTKERLPWYSDLLIESGFEDGWRDYIQRYNSIYTTCQRLEFSKCPAAQIETWVISPYDDSNHTLQSPAVQIETWNQTKGRYSHWGCNDQLIDQEWLGDPHDEAGGYNYGKSSIQIQGFCVSGARFVWGFSFKLTLVVSILHLVFTLLICFIWASVWTRSHSEPSHSVFSDATFMIMSAKAQYGDQIGEWTAERLRSDIVKGKKGLSRRKRRASRTDDDDMI